MKNLLKTRIAHRKFQDTGTCSHKLSLFLLPIYHYDDACKTEIHSRTLKNTQEHSRTLKEHSRTLKNISKYREQGNFTLQLLYTLIHLLKSHCSFWNKTIYHNGSLILEGKTLECLNPNLLKEAKYSSFVIVCIVSISFSYSDTYKKKGHPSTNVGINLN